MDKEKISKIYFWIIVGLLSLLSIVLSVLILPPLFDVIGGTTLEIIAAFLIFLGSPISIIFLFFGVYLLRKTKEETFYKKVRLSVWLNIIYIVLSGFLFAGLISTPY